MNCTILSTIALGGLLALSVGCSRAQEPSVFVGEWQLKYQAASDSTDSLGAADIAAHTRLTINEDHTFVLAADGLQVVGTWTADGNQLSLEAQPSEWPGGSKVEGRTDRLKLDAQGKLWLEPDPRRLSGNDLTWFERTSERDG